MYVIWYRSIRERWLPKNWVKEPLICHSYEDALARRDRFNNIFKDSFEHIIRTVGVDPNSEGKLTRDDTDTPESPQEAFWYVFCPSKGKPTVKHKSRSEALTEAHRLSRANLGVEFFVCKAESRVIHTQQIHVKENSYV